MIPALHAVTAGPIGSLDGRSLLLLLHGLGADERDLLPLAGELGQDDVVVSLRAPLPWGPGFAWAAVSADPTAGGAPMRPAADAVLAWLDALPGSELGTPARVRLLGFSQGGALALTLLRCAPSRFAAAVVLAGFLPEEAEPEGDAALALLRPPVLWARGDADEVIPPAAIARTAAWLPGHSTPTVRVEAALGHGISAHQLEEVRAFLAAG